MSIVKMLVFDVDLGMSIDSIIQQDVIELTADNKQHIDNIIAETTKQQQLIEDIKQTKAKKEQTSLQKLEELYNKILEHSNEPDNFMPTKDIMVICIPEMPNTISFVGKMRNWITAQNKQHKLSQVKKGKITGYRLDPAP